MLFSLFQHSINLLHYQINQFRIFISVTNSMILVIWNRLILRKYSICYSDIANTVFRLESIKKMCAVTHSNVNGNGYMKMYGQYHLWMPFNLGINVKWTSIWDLFLSYSNGTRFQKKYFQLKGIYINKIRCHWMSNWCVGVKIIDVKNRWQSLTRANKLQFLPIFDCFVCHLFYYAFSFTWRTLSVCFYRLTSIQLLCHLR